MFLEATFVQSRDVQTDITYTKVRNACITICKTVIVCISHVKDLIEGHDFIILYRWDSKIKGAEQQPTLVAKVLSMTLEEKGYDVWMDRKDLSVDSTELKRTIDSELNEKKVAVISIGVGDLERCAEEGDFFRWEIDLVRQLER